MWLFRSLTALLLGVESADVLSSRNTLSRTGVDAQATLPTIELASMAGASSR